MDHRKLLTPIFIRFIFFAINLFFTIRITSVSGWNFFSIFLASFAARDFVHAVRLAQVYYHMNKNMNNKQDK